jgi:signal transduction histidine kinase
MEAASSLMASPRKARLLQIAAVAIVYFLAARLGLVLAFENTNASPVWPPSGIAFAAVLIFGVRVWPGIAIGAFAANLVVFAGNHAASPAVIAFSSCSIALGNTIEALSGGLLGRRLFASLDPFDRARDVFKLLFVALLMCLTSATLGSASVCLAGIAPWTGYATIWFTWWLGDFAGVVILTPFLVASWKGAKVAWRPRRAMEAAALVVTLSVVGPAVFFGWFPDAPIRRESYLVIPILLWAVFRFGRREATAAVTVASGIAIWGTVRGFGPFSGGSLNESLLLLQAYVCVISVMTMSLSALLSERRRTEEELKAVNENLETRVRERTADVARANNDLRKINEDLRRRTSDLAQRNEEVEAFVYSVSHDLRAPLVNIQGFSRELELSVQALAGRLRDAALPPEIDREITEILAQDMPASLRFIVAGTGRSERLINALLLLSRSGREELRPERLDVEAIVRATLDALQQSIATKDAQVRVSSLPRAWGDVTAVGRVFSNLISNALNYRKAGRPGQIEIGGEERDEVNEYWVKDNGAGLSATAQERLFQVFQRFHPKLAEGEGMGLAIIKRLVERHGGRVWAESEEGSGSTFHFSLPATGGRREQA